MKIILEYSDKLIQTVTDKWKQENSKVTDSNAKQLIQRFDQIKNGLSSKLNIVSLPDNLKQGNKYLDITLYTLDDMIKLIKSIPENPEKVKKDAVANFVEKYQIDKPTAQSYVARFVSKKDDLKFGVKEGIEDRDLSKEDVLKFIPKKLQHNDMFLDPRNWEWEDFEHMLDALFPTQKEVSDEEGENTASTESDKIYDKDGIEVYKGDDVHKCISYNPVVKKKKKYGWCITQPGNTNYDYYRFEERQPTFYFIFDRNKTSEPEHSPFKDVWHAFVLQINSTGGYRITNANNNGDNQAKTWNDISKIVPADTWNKIKGLEKLFVPIKLSSTERGRKFASGKNLSVDEFKELSQDEKILYVQGKAQKQQLSNEILEVLTKYKIDLQGRSTTLANVAIDSGQEFPYSILKTNEPLAKRYAIFRFRHTDYGKNPISLPYVKYLDEEAKAKFLKTFDDNLTFEYIEKYFGENQAKLYVNEQAKTLNYLPDSAIKYISDPKLQNFYKLYNKLFQNWVFSNNTNISDEKLESLKTMPEQIVYPSPLLYDDWKSFSSADRKLFYDIAKRSDQDVEKYINASYAVPFFVQKGDIVYALLPESKSMDEWILSDFDGKIISKAKTEDFTLGGQNLFGGYPDYSSSDAKRVYNISEMKSTKKVVQEIKVGNPFRKLIFSNPKSGTTNLLQKYNPDMPFDMNWNSEYFRAYNNYVKFNDVSIMNSGEQNPDYKNITNLLEKYLKDLRIQYKIETKQHIFKRLNIPYEITSLYIPLKYVEFLEDIDEIMVAYPSKKLILTNPGGGNCLLLKKYNKGMAFELSKYDDGFRVFKKYLEFFTSRVGINIEENYKRKMEMVEDYLKSIPIKYIIKSRNEKDHLYIPIPQKNIEFLEDIDEIKVANPNLIYNDKQEEEIDEYSYDYEDDESDEIIDKLSHSNEFEKQPDSRLKTPSKRSFMDDEQISKLAKSVRDRLSESKQIRVYKRF